MRARAEETQGVEIRLRSALPWHPWEVWGQRSDSSVIKAALWLLCREYIIKAGGQERGGWEEAIAVIRAGGERPGPGAEL